MIKSKKREKQCSSEGLTNIVCSIRNIIFNTPTFGLVGHAEYNKTTGLGSVVYPSTQLRAIILAETVLAEAAATLSARQGCEGIKTPSTQKVATAETKAYSKINSVEDLVEGLFGNDPNARVAMPIFIIRTYFSLEKVGDVLLLTFSSTQ